MEVREGDVLFRCSNGYIKAISRVLHSFEDSKRPECDTNNWINWEEEGRKIHCDDHSLKVFTSMNDPFSK